MRARSHDFSTKTDLREPNEELAGTEERADIPHKHLQSSNLKQVAPV